MLHSSIPRTCLAAQPPRQPQPENDYSPVADHYRELTTRRNTAQPPTRGSGTLHVMTIRCMDTGWAGRRLRGLMVTHTHEHHCPRHISGRGRCQKEAHDSCIHLGRFGGMWDAPGAPGAIHSSCIPEVRTDKPQIMGQHTHMISKCDG
jgi:hypothetical protein